MCIVPSANSPRAHIYIYVDKKIFKIYTINGVLLIWVLLACFSSFFVVGAMRLQFEVPFRCSGHIFSISTILFRSIFSQFTKRGFERWGWIHQLVAATATATGSMSTGTGDRLDNEHEYLQRSLEFLEQNRSEEQSGDGYAVVSTER